MKVTDFLYKYKKTLNARIEDISISLTSGNASDMEAYKAMVGENTGSNLRIRTIKNPAGAKQTMTLIVPEYVLKQRQAKEKAEKEAKDKIPNRKSTTTHRMANLSHALYGKRKN